MAWQLLLSLIFEYDTVKFIHIKSRAVGILSRLLQLLIFGYIIGYVLVYKKGYQAVGDVESAVTTKVKGVLYPNISDSDFKEDIDPSLYKRIWDISDIIIPPSENGAFFVTTNIIVTSNQTLGKCLESSDIPDAKCDPENNTCTKGMPLMLGNGVMTGNCNETEINNKTEYVCEIDAWCPVEKDSNPLKDKKNAILKETKGFTVLIKNYVEFPLFGVRRRNIKEESNKTYLNNCRWHPEHTPDCPVFFLGDIVYYANKNSPGPSMDYETLALKGGIIAILINWDCNFDIDVKYCLPKYSFIRLDDPDAKLAPGWNFRYAHYYDDNTRTLFKAYGIKFATQVHGKGGKFNIVPLILNIGSGLALLAVQTFICDILILYFLKNRKYYQNKKYEEVNDEEDTIDPSVCIPDLKRKDASNYDRLED